MKPVLLLGLFFALSTGCASGPHAASSPSDTRPGMAESSAITSIANHSDYIWKDMPWGVVVAHTDAEVTSAIIEYEAANTALREHFDLQDQRGAVIVNSIASERDQIERVFDLDWVMPWDFGLSELSTEDQETESSPEPSDAQRASMRQQIVDQLSAGGGEPDPEMVETIYQTALKQFAEQTQTVSTDSIKPLRHELGHMLFVHGVWAIDDDVQQYASGAPDWLDETAAVLAEDPVLTERRREHIKELVINDEIMSFEDWFNMQHPVYGAAMKLLAQRMEREGDGPSTGAYLFTVDDFEAAGLEIDSGAADFYSMSRGFIDYLAAKSNDPRALQLITQDLKDGVSMDEILYERGAAFGLPQTFEALDKDFADWMIGQA
ncbi:MAG: hypothetical protein AAFV37_07150 [Pseudomonadota bacterium]